MYQYDHHLLESEAVRVEPRSTESSHNHGQCPNLALFLGLTPLYPLRMLVKETRKMARHLLFHPDRLDDLVLIHLFQG